jgi:hypothetical protein
MILEQASQEHVRKTSTNIKIRMLLRLMAAGYNLWGHLNAYLKSDQIVGQDRRRSAKLRGKLNTPESARHLE